MHEAVFGSHRVPPGHEASLAQAVGHVAACPSQANGAHAGAPAERGGRNSQVPGVKVQLSHAPLHGLSQQTPLAHTPVTHSESALHERPRFTRQVAVASHVRSPPQESASSAAVTPAHLPSGPQAWHTPRQAVSQHTPSAHACEAQSESSVHVAPRSLPAETNRVRTRSEPKPGVGSTR